MDGMTRTNTLSRYRVRHFHECGQTRESVACEGVLFTHSVVYKFKKMSSTSLDSIATMKSCKKTTNATFAIDNEELVQVVPLQILGGDGSQL